MKKSLCVIASAVLMSALAGCQKSSCGAECVAASDSTSMSVAYINTDSLLRNYEYAKKLSDMLMSKEESSRAEFNQKSRVFQQDVAEFQRKVQNNGFLSVDRAQKEEQRLGKVQQELQELNDKLSSDLMQEQARVNQELRDTLVNFLNQYAQNRYKLILSNTMGDNVLYSAPGVDITESVVTELNARYNASQK